MDSKKLDTGSRDAISLLPDEVLGNILSSLTTKEAASTSVLSKKWRNVFALVHNLDFDDSVFMHPEEGKQERDVIRESFRNFLDTTLALQSASPIKKFSLKCYTNNNGSDFAYVYRWICNAIERGVLELDVNIKGHHLTVNLPSQLFASKTLVKLTLGRKLSLGKLPSDVSLPSLKTLFIDTIYFEDDDLCGVLLAGCPVLEELSLHHDDFLAIPHTIWSPTIKRLSVDYEYSCNSMSFDLPKLVYLEYSHCDLDKYPQVKLESLIEAKLDLYMVMRSDVTDLIMGIRNVEILHLSPASVDVINSYCRYELIVFNNLVKLSFGSMCKRDWKLLSYLLKHSPKLETLIIQNLNGYDEICDDVFMHVSKVKVLHILGYRGTDEELRHLKSFLWKTESLEVFQVDVTAKDDCIILQTKRHLMMRLGVSLPSNCQIKVSHK